MTPGDARMRVFDDALACEEARPVAFVPGAMDAHARHAHGLRAEGLLRALAIVEDSRVDEPEDHGPTELALHRMEAKLDLLTALVARLAQRDGHDPVQPLRWTARGAELVLPLALAPGEEGGLRIQPSDWLPDPITLPARVLHAAPASAGTQAVIAFDALSPTLEAALERHLFRIHRRAVAEAKRR